MASESHPLIPSSNDEISPEANMRTNTWKYITLVFVLSCSAGVVLFGMSSKGWKFSESKAATKINIKFAKENKLMYTSLSMEEKASLFEEYKDTFSSTSFSTSDEMVRYQNFLSFLELVDERNSAEEEAGGTAVHGITIFADLSNDEFKSKFLGYKAIDRTNRRLSGKVAEVEEYTGTRTVRDWSGVYTTKIRNQGYCGSCWAFSAAEQLESDSIRAGLLTIDDKLSSQQILDCDEEDWGCDGGDPVTAYEYIARTGGLETETDYPYASSDGVLGTCAVSDSSQFLVTVDDYYMVDSEDDMKNYVLGNGPLSICVTAEVWSTYTSGILTDCGNHMSIDHCAQVVGVNTDEKYWIVRNSWTKNWGLDGYIYVAQGSNTCQISFRPSYVTVQKSE